LPELVNFALRGTPKGTKAKGLQRQEVWGNDDTVGNLRNWHREGVAKGVRKKKSRRKKGA